MRAKYVEENLKAVILVGGKGTRLRPLTITTPKPALPLMNRPFIEHLLKLCSSYGIYEVILSTSYMADVFEGCFKDGETLGIDLKCVTEDFPLDTCGAVKNVEKYIDGTFLVFNGDILTDLNLGNLLSYHKAKGGLGTLALTRVNDPTAFGLVPMGIDGRIIEFLEKPGWDKVTTDLINAGTYVLEPEILDKVPSGKPFSFERELFPELLQTERGMYGFPSTAYWLDIGTPEKYLLGHKDMLERRIPFDFPGKEIKPSVWIGEETLIEEGALVFGPTLIGNNCIIKKNATISGLTVLGDRIEIGEGAVVEGSVIFSNARIGKQSHIRNSVLSKGVVVGDKVIVAEMSVLGDDVKVGDENELSRGIRIWPEVCIQDGTVRFTR